MPKPTRRQWLTQLASLPISTHLVTRPVAASTQESGPCGLQLNDYQPRSMLVVPETRIEKPRYPVIDFHTHVSGVDRMAATPAMRRRVTREAALAVMDQRGLRTMVNLTGGFGPALEEAVDYWKAQTQDRFVVFTEPWYAHFERTDFAAFQGQQIHDAHAAGARGIKLTKALGLYLREKGRLVKIDDRRFDPMWEAAAGLNMPIAIHTSDPEAFFLSIDKDNERYEELSAHPSWSFHGKDFPPSRELHEARLRVVQRHPRTQFVFLHMGISEDLATVGSWLDRFPNVWLEFGARIGELGRQPRMSQRFFDQYQDRVLFGTDASPGGTETPQQIFGGDLYQIYYRFLETEDEYFDYAPAPKPPQGRWKIYGLGLSDSILRKVYHDNAARLLGMSLV